MQLPVHTPSTPAELLSLSQLQFLYQKTPPAAKVRPTGPHSLQMNSRKQLPETSDWWEILIRAGERGCSVFYFVAPACVFPRMQRGFMLILHWLHKAIGVNHP